MYSIHVQYTCTCACKLYRVIRWYLDCVWPLGKIRSVVSMIILQKIKGQNGWKHIKSWKGDSFLRIYLKKRGPMSIKLSTGSILKKAPIWAAHPCIDVYKYMWVTPPPPPEVTLDLHAWFLVWHWVLAKFCSDDLMSVMWSFKVWKHMCPEH